MTTIPGKIKILHLIKSLGRGGAEKLIPEAVSLHDKSRFEFHCLYFFEQKENIVEELKAAEIMVHFIPSGNFTLFFQVGRVKKFLRDHHFDLIHAHLPWAGILARLVGKNTPIPIIYTEHNTWERYNKLSYWGNRLTFKDQDMAIAVSNEVALSMRLNTFWDPYTRGGRLKIAVIQNGVNIDRFTNLKSSKSKLENPISSSCQSDPFKGSVDLNKTQYEIKSVSDLDNYSAWELRFKSKFEIPLDSVIIGKVAVFRKQKRLDIWVSIAFRILEKRPNVHFLLVGDGEAREEIERSIKDSGFSANFHLLGLQHQVLPFLNLMDIYLSTSEFEGLPIAMLEAMACEVPVVATSAGGIGEVIEFGKEGFLVDVHRPDDLIKYCIHLIDNKKLRYKMSKAARKRVVDSFSLDKMVRQLESIYLEYVNEFDYSRSQIQE